MQRSFLLNITFLLCLNFLIKPFYIFGIDRVVQNEVGPEIYGLYFSLFNFTYLLQFFADLGINSFNTRHIAQNGHLLQKYFSRLISLKLILAVFYLVFILIIGLSISYASVLDLLVLIAVSQALSTLLLYMRSNISGLGWYMWDSILSVTDKFLMILICGILLWMPVKEMDYFRIEWFVYAQILSFSVSLLLSLILIWKRIRPLQFYFRRIFSIALLKQTLPFALAFLLMTAYMRIDAVMLERLLDDGKYQAGMYAGAYRILDAVAVIGYLFSVLLYPMFSKQLKAGESVSKLLILSVRLLLGVCFMIVVPVAVFSHEIMNVLYISADAQWGLTMQVLIFSLVPLYIVSIFGTLITANGSLIQLNKFFGLGIVLNVSLNLLLIFDYGALGASIATLATQLFMAALHIYFGKKWVGVTIPMSLLLVFGSLLITALVIVTGISLLSGGLLIELFLSVTIIFLLLVVTRSFDLQQLLQLVKGRENGLNI